MEIGNTSNIEKDIKITGFVTLQPGEDLPKGNGLLITDAGTRLVSEKDTDFQLSNYITFENMSYESSYTSGSGKESITERVKNKYKSFTVGKVNDDGTVDLGQSSPNFDMYTLGIRISNSSGQGATTYTSSVAPVHPQATNTGGYTKIPLLSEKLEFGSTITVTNRNVQVTKGSSTLFGIQFG